MLKAGYSQMRIVLTIYGVCAIAGMLSTGYVNYLADYVCLLLGMFLLASILIVLLRFFFPLQTPELPNSEPSNPA
jgi:predicted MFS family arabinose efflux permease